MGLELFLEDFHSKFNLLNNYKDIQIFYLCLYQLSRFQFSGICLFHLSCWVGCQGIYTISLLLFLCNKESVVIFSIPFFSCFLLSVLLGLILKLSLLENQILSFLNCLYFLISVFHYGTHFLLLPISRNLLFCNGYSG